MSTKSYNFFAFVERCQMWSGNGEIFFPNKLHGSGDGLYALVCFQILPIVRKFMALSFKFHRCLLSYVLFLLFGLLEKALWFANLVLKAFSVIVLNRFVVFRDDSGLVNQGFFETVATRWKVGRGKLGTEPRS